MIAECIEIVVRLATTAFGHVVLLGFILCSVRSSQSDPPHKVSVLFKDLVQQLMFNVLKVPPGASGCHFAIVLSFS